MRRRTEARMGGTDLGYGPIRGRAVVGGTDSGAGDRGLAIEFKPRGKVPAELTSTLFFQDVTGKRHLRLDYGYHRGPASPMVEQP